MTTELLTEAKARLYKTAIFTDKAREFEPGLHGSPLPLGPVRVVFMGEFASIVRQRHECVFSCFATMHDESYIGDYYETALKDFVL